MKKKRFTIASLVLTLAAGFAFGVLADRGLDLDVSPAFAAFGDQNPAGKVSLKFQEVESNIIRTIHRAPVPGGWLIAQQSGLAFVPDPDHKWKGETASD